MPNEKKMVDLEQKDLATPEAFRQWIKKNLEHLYVQKDIPNDHLLIYLDYIRSIVSNDKEKDVPFWMDLVRDLENDVKSIKRTEE